MSADGAQTVTSCACQESRSTFPGKASGLIDLT